MRGSRHPLRNQLACYASAHPAATPRIALSLCLFQSEQRFKAAVSRPPRSKCGSRRSLVRCALCILFLGKPRRVRHRRIRQALASIPDTPHLLLHWTRAKPGPLRRTSRCSKPLPQQQQPQNVATFAGLQNPAVMNQLAWMNQNAAALNRSAIRYNRPNIWPMAASNGGIDVAAAANAAIVGPEWNGQCSCTEWPRRHERF
ncbi:hypothetical protein L1887_53497 [Cichorium endivia]|nr:hypothetical protein L1887_53497 [Cichorium endivia]